MSFDQLASNLRQRLRAAGLTVPDQRQSLAQARRAARSEARTAAARVPSAPLAGDPLRAEIMAVLEEIDVAEAIADDPSYSDEERCAAQRRLPELGRLRDGLVLEMVERDQTVFAWGQP